MSSKHQSESTATAQDETHSASPEEVVAAETSDEAVTAATVSEEGENAASVTEDDSSEPQFKVTDKRRVVVEEDDPPGATELEDDPESAAETFEIDLDQLKLDAQAVERELADLRAQLKESEARRDEAMRASEDYADRFRRAQMQLRIETEEMRGRLQRTFEQKLEIARGDVVAGLLDTLDNLQRAVAAADVTTESGAAFESLRDGVRATAEMFENQLKKMGLHAVASEGEPFNPEVHEAVEVAPAPKEQDNIVLAELQRGYKFGDRLLRPARVKVGRAD